MSDTAFDVRNGRLGPRNRHATAITLIAAAGLIANLAAAIVMVAAHPAPAYPWPLILVSAPTLLVGALIYLRKPGEVIGWLLLGAGVAMGGMILLGEYAMYSTFGRPSPLPLTGLAAWLSSVLQAGAVFAILVVLVVYPTGTLVSPRWRWLVWAAVVAGINAFAVTAFAGPMFNSNLDTIRNPVGIDHPSPLLVALVTIGNAISFLAIGGAVAQLIFRLIGSRGDEREQLKWFVYVAVVGPLLLWVVPFLVPHSWSQWFGDAAWTLVPIALIASIAVAVLKYRLYDIDVVIRKTLILGLLALFVTAVYVVTVAGLGAAVGGRSPALSFVAAVVVAVAFQPVRDRASRLADRLVYARRATPYEVLTEFSSQAADAVSTDDVLPRLARIVAEGTGARRARVWLRVAGSFMPTASWPPDDGVLPSAAPATADDLPPLPATESFAVSNSGALLGAIALDEDPADPLTPAKSKLARDVAAQAGLVLRNVQLVEDLRASRQRIVSAQDEERRRIQRSLHSGAERRLVEVEETLALAEQAAVQEAAPNAQASVRALRTDAGGAHRNLRGLALGIYPPLLRQAGIAAALRAQTDGSPLVVDVEAHGVGRYPIDVEAAIYFCALEAVQNASKYAEASRVRIALSALEGSVAFEVMDDGRGFDAEAHGYGTGLQGMADRLETLGGSLEVRSAPGHGTTVAGVIPHARVGVRA